MAPRVFHVSRVNSWITDFYFTVAGDSKKMDHMDWTFVFLCLYVGGISAGLIVLWYVISKYDEIVLKKTNEL